METVATWFGYGKPDPRQERRKCLEIIRKQELLIRNCMVANGKIEAEYMKQIKEANRSLRHPAKAAEARNNLLDYGRELVKARDQRKRLVTALEQMRSFRKMVYKVSSTQTIENALRTGTQVLKDLNQSKSHIYLPAGTRQMQTELIKAEVMEDLLEDILPQTDDVNETAVQDVIDDVTEAQINNAIADVLNQSPPAKTVQTPAPVAQKAVVEAPQEKLDEEKQDEGETAEALLEDMNHRLQALRS